MKLSKNFLNDFIDVSNIDINTLANELLLVGNEFESIKKLSSATNIVIGYVLDAHPHPDSDHLTVCDVLIGDYSLQILCGAPNVKENIKVIVALPGAVLPNGMVIEKRQIRGLESNGMICSLGELGIESKYLSEEEKLGIHILPDDAKVGIDGIKYLEFNDEIIDFELTANRGDLMSILGFAHEVGAVFDKPLKDINCTLNNEIEDIKDYMNITIDTPNCPLYLGRVVKNVTIKESPNFIKARLIASGIRPINNVVDISNYVMLIFGTPLHFFDLDKLNKNITVRMAHANEDITTLDKIVRKLDDTDIVITSDNKPIALAGVMGGLDTEILLNTQNVFIEAAIFNPTSIRKTSKKILKSEASSRFEKGIDKARCYQAINYAVYLLEKYASGSVIKNTSIYDIIPNKLNIIEISLAKINGVLGIELELDKVLSIFQRLGFKTEVKNDIISVEVLSHRLDISILEDLIEEVGRINKMDNLTSKTPLMSVKAGVYEQTYYKKNKIKERLTALGLFEVITYTLTDLDNVNKYNSNKELISILDPLSSDKKYLRTSLIPSLLNVYDYNNKRGAKDLNIFEISNIYYDKDKSSTLLTILISGDYLNVPLHKININNNFYLLKGIIENLFDYLGITNRYSFNILNIPNYFHPDKSCNITFDNEVIGYMGEIHPSIISDDIYTLEINLDKILDTSIRGIKNKEISKYPSIYKDLAVIVDDNITALELIKTIKNANNKILEDVVLFDLYKGLKTDTNKISMAFNLKFADKTKTLTEIEVMEVFNKIIQDLETKHQAILRDK